MGGGREEERERERTFGAGREVRGIHEEGVRGSVTAQLLNRILQPTTAVRQWKGRPNGFAISVTYLALVKFVVG